MKCSIQQQKASRTFKQAPILEKAAFRANKHISFLSDIKQNEKYLSSCAIGVALCCQRSHLLQEEVLVGLHAHCMLVFAADLVEEPMQCVIVTLRVLHQTMPQDVHLLQTQPWHTHTERDNQEGTGDSTSREDGGL